MNYFKLLYDCIAYLLSPPLCFSCRGYVLFREILCQQCEDNLELVVPKMFQINATYILTVYAVSRYTEPLRPMLFGKYRADSATIEKVAELIWRRSVISLVHVDCFIPIPLHWMRNMQRGFNQSQLIADFLSQKFAQEKSQKVPVVHGLKRVRKTESQVQVEQVDRRCNVKNAFELAAFDFDIAGKHIVLVDDSCTTGSTALEAAKMLVKLKPASINMVVACRAL